MIRFAARTTHPWALRGWIWVTVHDTVDELRAAGEARSGEDQSAAAAMFQPEPIREHCAPDGTWTTLNSRYGGVMRLTRDVDGNTLAHECVHAAAALWRRQRSHVVDLEDDCGDPEETFAYVVGDLTGVIAYRLTELGVWPLSA